MELLAHLFPMSRAGNSLLAMPGRKAAASKNCVLPGRNRMNISKGGKNEEIYSWPKLGFVDFNKALSLLANWRNLPRGRDERFKEGDGELGLEGMGRFRAGAVFGSLSPASLEGPFQFFS